ncbi:MAG: SRPBCC domain-containing protein [Cyclobacteriaceae bacterium]
MGLVRKEIQINASKERVFKALTDPFEIENWSGAPVEMDRLCQGRFSLWGGSIVGINLSVSPERIEQKWKESRWGTFSNLIFEITDQHHGTLLKLIHYNVPESSLTEIEKGWDDYYLMPIKSYLEL